MQSGGYRDLEVYELAHEVGVSIHKFSLLLPKYELYETGSQMRRASKSISANIVEGYGRKRYKQDFVRFLVYAHSSCDETTEWLQYVKDCHSPFQDEIVALLAQLDKLGRKINRFLVAVEREHRSSK